MSSVLLSAESQENWSGKSGIRDKNTFWCLQEDKMMAVTTVLNDSAVGTAVVVVRGHQFLSKCMGPITCAE